VVHDGPRPDETAPPLASALVRAGRAGRGRRIAFSNGTAPGSVNLLMDRRAFLTTVTGGLSPRRSARRRSRRVRCGASAF
jgi:hypothetical protein